MNTIPKDAYTDELLLNVKISKPGAAIIRDAYADRLLHYVHDKANTPEFTINDATPAYGKGKDVNKPQ